jgi:tetratricopeptide (TPR) repeat protein
LQQAVEAYRTLLVAGGPVADVNFALADLLYRMGDLPAARERFYAAVELDEEYVEARANLGCVLAENNELELAVAAFQGALAFHPDYADVHYHLANSYDRLDQHSEAELHWHSFLALAPESPWADSARSRLEQANKSPLSVSTPGQ